MPDASALVRRARAPFVLLLAVLVIGTVGFWLVWRPDDATWLDALYMTIITVTTVGYAELYPLGAAGRTVAMVVALAGIASLFYLFGVVMEYLVARELFDPFDRRAMKRTIEELEDHIVVAGFGRMGQRAAEELAEAGADFVVVDHDADAVDRCRERGWLVVQGDAEEDETLSEGGIGRAAGLIVATASDASNAFVVMSARALNAELTIVARADDAAAVRKLERAGADSAIDLYTLGGRRLARGLLHPAAIEFFSNTLRRRREQPAIEIEEVTLRDETLAGQTLRSLDLRARTGASVLAIVRGDEADPNPDPGAVLELGDHLVVLGTADGVAKLRRLVHGADVPGSDAEGARDAEPGRKTEGDGGATEPPDANG